MSSAKRGRGTRAQSFEQNLLWSVLDQVAVPHVFSMARDRWNIDSPTAWSVLQRQAALGRVVAYRQVDGRSTPVTLTQVSLGDVADDFILFLQPTAATFARLLEIETGSGGPAAIT